MLKSKLLRKKAYSGYYSAKEVSRNAQVPPSMLRAEWYDLQPSYATTALSAEGLVPVNEEWVFVPVDLQHAAVASRTASVAKGTHVYHGTDAASAKNIREHGIDLSKCTAGYFGVAFYTAFDPALAKSNYADFSDDEEGGVVLEFEVVGGNILDLSDPKDWDTYSALSIRPDGSPNFPQKMRQKGVDGIADNSFGGVCFYNPRCLRLVG